MWKERWGNSIVKNWPNFATGSGLGQASRVPLQAKRKRTMVASYIVDRLMLRLHCGQVKIRYASLLNENTTDNASNAMWIDNDAIVSQCDSIRWRLYNIVAEIICPKIFYASCQWEYWTLNLPTCPVRNDKNTTIPASLHYTLCYPIHPAVSRYSQHSLEQRHDQHSSSWLSAQRSVRIFNSLLDQGKPGCLPGMGPFAEVEMRLH